MRHRITNGNTLNSLIEQLKAEGYHLVIEETTVEAFIDEGDEKPVMWAMQHSNGKNWLLGYERKLITEGARN